MDDLLEPEVTAVLSRFQASLQRMFRAYCGLDSALGYTNRFVVRAASCFPRLLRANRAFVCVGGVRRRLIVSV